MTGTSFPQGNTVVTEGGKEVEIVDIRREVAACSVALVLDSSGSMADDMMPTIAAAQRFVESLPDSSFVKIIDFAGYVNALSGETKADALRALSTITAADSTKLYDATLEGLKQVENKTRPAVVDSSESPGTKRAAAAQGAMRSIAYGKPGSRRTPSVLASVSMRRKI